ncbi:DNA-binding protein [Sulfurospirillum sp. T05]|uniref:DNA-binding protein n=1 Tax=Sulfurospirillum tamanense TaxID=2813362 RepID=A0ABS2WSA9_9BACT|nr:DNA-binding protein [Sulfurospirillum tamanensis]
MTQTLQIGRINQLMIERKSDPGLYLKAGDGEEVLLPNAYVSITMEIGQTLDVFVYTDSEDRLVASTRMPEARLGEFALLEVKDVTSFGAFCDWGLPKELFVPVKFQKTPFKVGQKRVIRVSLDEQTNRLIGVEKFGKFLTTRRPDFSTGDEVALFVLASTPLGFKAIVNNRFTGMLFHNEVFEPLHVGKRTKGYIKEVRQDGKITLSLRPLEKGDVFAKEKVLSVLRANGYALPFAYKATPEEVYAYFGLSKKAYKQALTQLQEEGAITLDENGIRFSGA